AEAYRDVLRQSAHVEMLDLDPMIAERAADLRARYDLRLPDALQVAAALVVGAGYFITNDTRVRRVTETEVIVLADVS
ncbi:MAG: type II toxin-antitoxin system VapC family toxin, partial [Dehalococcoidia bacterium]